MPRSWVYTRNLCIRGINGWSVLRLRVLFDILSEPPDMPLRLPSIWLSDYPSRSSSSETTDLPSEIPIGKPSRSPSSELTGLPSRAPIEAPSHLPTAVQSDPPSEIPTGNLNDTRHISIF